LKKSKLQNKTGTSWPILLAKNDEIQNSLADSGEQNIRMIKVARENGALAAKLAGAGGGGTIIALTLEPERTIRALREAGAEEFVELAPYAEGVKVDVVEEDSISATQ